MRGNFDLTNISLRFGRCLCPYTILLSARIFVADDLVNKSQFPLIMLLGFSKPGEYVETKNNEVSSSFPGFSVYDKLCCLVDLQTLTMASSSILSGYPRLLKCFNRVPMCLIKLFVSLHMRLTLSS